MFAQNLLASPHAEPLPVHPEVQQVETTVIAVGEESHGQGQGSNDSEDHLIPPSSPAAESISDVSVHVVKFYFPVLAIM